MRMTAGFSRALAAVALAAATPAAGQELALSWLEGNWQGNGTMMGEPSEARLEVAPVLGHTFFEFRYYAGAFEGRAFYQNVEINGWRAHWFDNRGVSFAIEGVTEVTTLTSDWTGSEERGRTIYRLAEDGRLHITDSVARPDGGYSVFAEHVLTRVEP